MPSNQELEKICNVAGYPIYKWAADQLKVRSEKGSQDTRNDDNLTYLANKNAWVRVVSSVNLEPNLIKYFSTNLQIGLTNGRSLAENFILYGGTSTYAFKSQQLNAPALGINNLEIGDALGSKTQGMNLRSGLGAYNITGNQEINDYGYRPMPGITSVTIDTTGRMGSLRQATINFKVWDKNQLDIMDALYFRLGFTVLLEWGHAKYYDNGGNLKSTDEFMINPFQQGLTKESINIALASNTRKSYGNYGGMLGVVTSFNFTMTQDGGYDCVVKAMSLGAVMGNYAINHVSSLANVYYEQIKGYLNNEKESARKKAFAEIEAQEKKDIEEANNRLQSSPYNWPKLQIRDYLSNILFNTNSKVGGDFQVFRETQTTFIKSPEQKGIELSEVELPIRTIKTNQNLNTPGNSTAQIIGIKSEILDTNYYRLRANTLLQDFKKKNNISKSSSKQEISTYYVRNGIIFFEKGTTETNQKYIAQVQSDQGKDTPISIKLDTDYLFNIVSNKVPTIKIINSDLKPDEIKPFKTYAERIFQENGKNIVYKKSDISFSVVFDHPRGFTNKEVIDNRNNAQIIFSNPNTEYYIDSIETNINGYSKIILSVKDKPNYKIILGNTISEFADLAIIKSIIGVQRLNGSLPLIEKDRAVTKAEQDALKKKEDTEKRLQNEYDTDTVKSTINSESTIELMLKSLLLYGINNVKYPELLTGKPYQNFIQNLFSEGAYAPIFKKEVPGKPNYDKYTDDFYQKYMNGSLNSLERLETNFRYGNNFYLMSGENAYLEDSNGNLKIKNQLKPNSQIAQYIPQVNFEELFKVLPVPYGETANLEIEDKSGLSVYISLGLFFLILNHTGILYNSETDAKMQAGDVITPMTYVDFNPETNFYLSSINQISIDPYKFLVPYTGTIDDYKELFEDSLLENGSIKAPNPKKTEENKTAATAAPTPLFNFENQDKLSGALPQQKKSMEGTQDGYIGKLMYVMVDINYLLRDVIGSIKNNSSTNEVYFQTTIEKILADLNKCMGNYNAFRLSYNDNSNCYVITDDQIQTRPDKQVANVHGDLVRGKDDYEIPIFGKKSIARSFEIRTDISSRLASMLAISSNPGAGSQVVNAKNTTDFGVYNTGSFDRYIPMKTIQTGQKKDESASLPAIELATNFNSVVKSIYTYSRQNQEETKGNYISQDSINRATSYYIDKMARVKNLQPESVHAMIIPVKSSITMDGMAGLYPFQLYTIDERILPYRYNSDNLSNAPQDLRKVAFSISKMTHTISDNQWTTSVDGFMTLLRNQTKDQINVRSVKPTVIDIPETDTQDTIEVNQTLLSPVRTRRLTNTEVSTNAKIIYEYFIKKGLPNYIAAGFVGNFYQESGLNPQVINSIGATGIAQWLGSRKDRLLKKPNPFTLQTQLDFAWEELNGSEKKAFIAIQSANSVSEATIKIRKKYERPGEAEANDKNRIDYALKVFNNLV